MTRTITPLLLALALATGCGPSGTSDDATDGPPSDGVLPPILIPGGGATSAPIDGVVNVFVVEPGGATPIVGAAVHLGGAGGPVQLDATTDAAGLATFRDAAVTGPQTITATAGGRTAATWLGVPGGNVTIPLARRPAATPMAHVTGTIAGWGSLPGPGFGHYTLAVVTYSFTGDPSAADNRIPQPTSGGTPLNTCINSGLGGSCAWEMNARTGAQLHTAVIVDGDSRGTSDAADDTYTLIGFAAGSPMTLGAGQQVSGESLTIVPAGGRTTMTVQFPAAAPGLGHALAIPMLDTGATGQIVFPLPPVTAASPSTQVLAATGAFAGSYRLVGLATPSATAVAPYSSSFVAVANPGSAALPTWLPAPTGVSAAGGTFAFTAGGGTALAYASFSTGGSPAWVVTVLDGSSSFRLPPISPDPLSGSVTLDVTTVDVAGFDPAQFLVTDLSAGLARASGATTTFTR